MMALPIAKAEGGNLAPPKRFLTAYNFFYMDERAKLLSPKEKESASKSTKDNTSLALDKESKPWVQRKGKRAHRKTHGKISFVSLAKDISAKWKSLSPEERKVYNDLAQEDLARYRKELSAYKKANPQHELSKNKKKAASNAKATKEEEKKTAMKSTKKNCKKEAAPPDQCKSTQESNASANGTSSKKQGPSPCLPLPTLPPFELTDAVEKRKTKASNNEPYPKKISSVQRKSALLPSSEEDDSTSRSTTKSAEDDIESIEGGCFADEALNSESIDSFSTMAISVSGGTDKKSIYPVVYESHKTRILQVPDSQNKLGGKTGIVAIKMLADQFPNSKQTHCIKNEFNISQHLSECSSTRSAIKLSNQDGFCGVYLEWVPGITLKEWIKSAHNIEEVPLLSGTNLSSIANVKHHFDYENAVRLAEQITKALAMIHEFGVVHHKISTENIIVNVNKVDDSFLVKIIDLSKASAKDKLANDTDCFQDDLLSLGEVFYELFLGTAPPKSRCSSGEQAGNFPMDEDHDDVTMHSKDTVNNEDHPPKYDCSALFESKIPRCISTLILKLIKNKSVTRYCRSADDVREDLSAMLLHRDVFLWNAEEETEDQLNLNTGKLYGRQEHMSAIIDAFRRVCQSKNSSEMVMVSGYSGAGKSALVQGVRKPMTDMGGKFLCGKYDKLRQTEPLSAINAAFARYCSELVTGDVEELLRTRKAIQENVGSEIALLRYAIPSLSKIIQFSEIEPIQVDMAKAQLRFRYVFEKFIRAIATPDEPLILFLDDLQWADPQSLSLITSLVTGVENKYFLFIGAYRENEVDEMHILTSHMRSIESRGHHINKINVGKLSKKDTNELIADMIRTPPHLTTPLADVVYRKTGGNVLFVLQFLLSIYDENYLNFSLSSRKWQWDTSLVESMGISDNVVALMSRRILQLPMEIQIALKLLACLGNSCEESILSLFTPTPGFDAFGGRYLIVSLKIAITEGLVDCVDSNYRFTHDQIGFAAYSLIPEDKRKQFHLWIGRQMLANSTLCQGKALFVTVGQLNRGANLIDNTEQKVQLAELNLKVGREAISAAAFLPAAFYLKTGIGLLDKDSWAEHYHLCLQLFGDYSNVLQCIGEHEKVDNLLEVIFTHASCLYDKLSAYLTLIRSKNLLGKPADGLRVGMSVLSQLGEALPIYSDIKSIVMVEFAKAKHVLEKKTDAELLSMKDMNNSRKIAAMRFMHFLAVSSFFSRPGVYCLIALRMVQLSLTHGICGESAFAFASYANLLAGVIGDIGGAHRFAKLSLRFLDTSSSSGHKESFFFPGVSVVVHSFVFPWTVPYQASLQPLGDSFKVGMRYGDLIMSMGSARFQCVHALQCGEDLKAVEKRFRNYANLFSEAKQVELWRVAVPFWQATLNLMGQSNDPSQLTGETMNQDEFEKECLQNNRLRILIAFYHIRSWLAYMFGDYELALRMVEKRAQIEVSPGPCFLVTNISFVEGMFAFAISDQQGTEKWRMLAQKSLKQFESFALFGPSNYKHRFLLLKAESFVRSGEFETAERMYEEAINTAGECGFIQDQALAYERVGIFHLSQGKTSSASKYYGLAHSAYLKWGARCKADQLRLQCPF